MTKNAKSAIAFAVAALMICVVFVGLVSHKNSQTEVFAEELGQSDEQIRKTNNMMPDEFISSTTLTEMQRLVPVNSIIKSVSYNPEYYAKLPENLVLDLYR